MSTNVRLPGIVIFGVLFATTTYGQPVVRQLPAPIVESLCAKYKGVPAFVRGGEVIRIDCAYVTTLARIDAPTLAENYRQIIGSAVTLDGLRTSSALPPDQTCGSFSEQRIGQERMIECHSLLGGQDVAFRFYADAAGQLTRVETSFNYYTIYRTTLGQAVTRGSISKFFDAYVELQTDLQIAKLRYTAAAHDRVVDRDGAISVVVSAQ